MAAVTICPGRDHANAGEQWSEARASRAGAVARASFIEQVILGSERLRMGAYLISNRREGWLAHRRISIARIATNRQSAEASSAFEPAIGAGPQAHRLRGSSNCPHD